MAEWKGTLALSTVLELGKISVLPKVEMPSTSDHGRENTFSTLQVVRKQSLKKGRMKNDCLKNKFILIIQH